MSSYRCGKVQRVADYGQDAQIAELLLDDGALGVALALTKLNGSVSVGDELVVNTTAVELGLGSGGLHFVLWNLSRRTLDTEAPGHIMKLRYTPLQHNVEAVEEKMPELPPAGLAAALDGMPVIAGSLHSQLLAVALAYRYARRSGKLVYIMTDGGCLPLAFSRTAAFASEEGLVDTTVTCGHAFGGDLEAVNIYGALLAARVVCRADAVVALMGPGIAGTGSAAGFSGMEQAEVINAAASLGATPIAIPRITFGDARARHRGVSHHTVSVLSVAARARAVVALPLLPPEKGRLVARQLRESRISEKHEIREVDARVVTGLLEKCGMKATVMGRSPEEEPEFFMTAGAAGLTAAGMGGE